MPPRRKTAIPVVAPPTDTPEAEAFIRGGTPKSVADEGQRAHEAAQRGSRYLLRGERPVRITVDLPPALHKVLRIRCVEDGLDARAIVIRALALYGVTEPTG